jgi:hypothetical protein
MKARFVQGVTFVLGALFVVLSLAWVGPPEGLLLGALALGIGAGLLALANAPAYVTRGPGGARTFERTSFCWSCVFLGLPLVALFAISLLCRP